MFLIIPFYLYIRKIGPLDVEIIVKYGYLDQLMRLWYKLYKYTVKPVLIGHSKKDKTKVLEANGSLMKVKSIAECSLGAFCNTFDLYSVIISLENQFVVFFLSGRLRQVLLYPLGTNF